MDGVNQKAHNDMFSYSKRLLVLSILIGVFGCDDANIDSENNFSLSSVASYPYNINSLKRIYYFCEKCIHEKSCHKYDRQQCQNVTIPSRNEALSLAISTANIEAVYFLIDVAKADVNGVTGDYKETPLIIAAYYGSPKHQQIASFLLLRGADINKKYPAVGHNALGVARWKRNYYFEQFLLKYGAK